MADRKLSDLCSVVQPRFQLFLTAVRLAEVDFLITCTFRSAEEQDLLYAQGRTTPGRIITNAKAGYSMHNFGCAIDGVPLRHGKPLWSVFQTTGIMEPEWKKLGELAALHGIEWAGNWTSFKEYAHFQYSNGLTLEELRAGKEIK